MRPDYSVVIPAFNEQELLPRALSRLKAAMAAVPSDGEVIVVDNNSTDATAAVARGFGAAVVHEPVNQISRARNAGARAARGRFLVFLDADTELSPDLLKAALERLEKGAAGGGAFIELEGAGRASFVHRLLPYFSRALARLGICGGSFIYCAREAFDGVKGFSESVYAAEDVLFSRAVRRWGRRRGRPFEIITAFPIKSSDRKLRWHGPISLGLTLALFAFFPFAVRFRSLCRLWYGRPPQAAGGSSAGAAAR